jgi:hypothetical protein
LTLPRRLSGLLIGAAVAAAILLPGGASACACGEFQGVVVAHGKSLYGVPWRIKAAPMLPRTKTSPPGIRVHFSIGDPDGTVGYFTSLPRRLPPELVFTAIKGSGISDYPESDLSGVAQSRAVELVVKMSDGQFLTVRPTPAPPETRKRFPWLRGLRFFDVFFPSSQEPLKVTAFDRDRRVLAREQV